MKLWFARVFYRAGLFWWSKWSMLYRRLYHKKYEYLLIMPCAPTVANETLRRIMWSPDTPKELWDACGSPGWVQHCLNEERLTGVIPEGALDCDDFSAWACESLTKAAYNTQLLTVVYMRDGELHGHVVCMITEHVDKDTNTYRHLSNWGLSPKFADRLLLIADILNTAKAQDIVGWALLGHRDMKVHIWRVG